MMKFDSKITKKEREIDGVSSWYCLEGDRSWDLIASSWIEHKYREILLQFCPNRNIALQAGGSQGVYPRLLSNFF